MPTVATYDALLSGQTWDAPGAPGRPAFLTYSFDAAPAASLSAYFPADFLTTFQTFNTAEQAVARQALNAWADASGLTLFEVPPGQGDIRFGLYDFAHGPANIEVNLGFAFNPLVTADPSDPASPDLGGDVFIDIGHVSFGLLAHEIGHALGLKHPFEGDTVLDPSVDDLKHTVMTYNPAGGPASALGTLDVQAIQAMYGPASADGTEAASWSWDAARDVLTQAGGPGAETLAGVAVADRIFAGDGGDYVFTRGGDDQVSGGAGGDTVAAGDGSDTVDGGGGDDVIHGDAGDDSLLGGDGSDSLWGMAGSDTLDGGPGADFLYAGDGLSRLSGGSGDDTIVLSGGPAIVDGGAGNDQLWIALPGPAGGALSYASLTAHGGSYTGIESIVMFGAAGADTLVGGDLPDQLQGGAGGDSLSGGGANDVLWGQDGADTILGGSGQDYIDAGAGDDLIAPGVGADTIVGGTGEDTVDFSGELEAVVVTINAPHVVDGVAVEQMTQVEDLIGTAYGDRLTGDAGPNRLWGGGGDDTVAGGDGANYLRGDDGGDSLVGGAQFDDINGNAGSDTAAGGGGDDWVVGGKDDDRLGGDDGDDLVYGNLGNDTCDGGTGADTLRGGQGDDVLTGGPGDDFLSGDRGDDTLTGGAGADIFHTFGDAGVDRVTDFRAAEGDRVMLDPGTTYALAQVGADTVITMAGGGQMILVGVALNTLSAGWIFGA